MGFNFLRKACRAGKFFIENLLRYVLLALCIAYSLTALAAPSEPSSHQLKIGVLALRGIPQALTDWTATADYLSEKLPGYRFQIVPLSYDQLEPNVANGKVDFVIVNPAIYVALARHFGITPVATLINRLDDYDSSSYGGVVFRRADATGAPSFEWIKGKRFLAVSPMSLGGFLAARLEFYEHGIDPFQDFSSITFAGTHDAVVMGVLEGRADAGTTRTDVLERMAAEGKIDLSQIEVIAPYRHAMGSTNSHFPYLRSTRLYPEWPFAKLAGVPDDIARQVSRALLAMPQDSHAARNAQIYGWNVPLSYMPVVALLMALKLPPFEPEPMTVQAFIDAQPLASLLILVSVLITIGFIGLLLRFNNRLCRAKDSLVQLNEQLEDRVKERTAVLEAKERELENLATHDALTGLLNRRALENRIVDEVNRVNRYDQPLSVLMIDIDFFKTVNDRFGHMAGDNVLRDLAQLLLSAVRVTDIVARYGEEFVVLLPMINQEDAIVLAERLCQQVAAQEIALGNSQTTHITVSIGVSSVSKCKNASWESLLNTADQAMYSAKQGGRNQVCIA